MIAKLIKYAFLLLLVFGSAVCVSQEALPSINGAESIKNLMDEGRKLLQQKQYDRALQFFEAVLSKDDTNAEALFFAGTIYITQKQQQKGLSYIERSVKLAPKNMKLRLILAKTYESLSLADKALEMYHQIEQIAPGSPEAKESNKEYHLLLGNKYGKQGKFDKALQEFSAILKNYPDDVVALMNKGIALSFMGRLDEAQQALEKALKIQPGNPLLHKHLADIYERKGDIKTAKEQYQRVIQLVPEGTDLAKLAEIKLTIINGEEHLATGELIEARSEFEKALAFDPKNYSARMSLATVYHSLGNLQKAQDILLSLIDEDPNNLDARLKLGTLYLEENKQNEAVNALEFVITHGKGSKFAQQASTLLDKIRQAEKEQSSRPLTINQRIALYKEELKKNPNDRQAWLDLGLLYVQLQRKQEAIDALDNATRLNPDDAKALAILAGLYRDTGMLDKAIEAYKHALELEKNPNQRKNLEDQLAIVKARKSFNHGNMKDAEEQFKKILGKDKNNYTANFYLGLIYSRDGRLEDAIQAYQNVLKAVPGHLSARLNLAIAYEQVGRDEDAISEYQFVVRSGVPKISDTAKSRLEALMKRVGGFTYNLSYSLIYDSNSNLSSTNSVDELRSDTTGSFVYSRKLRHKRVYWGLNFSPTYSVYHQVQFDFLQMEVNPFARATWKGMDFSANYSYSQTDSVLVKRNYNKSNNINMDALKRFKMFSLMPFLTAKEQRGAAPSVFRINMNYRNFKSQTSPLYNANSYSLGLLLNQGSMSGWSWVGNYTYTVNNNVNQLGNDFAYTSHGVNFQLSKSIMPKLNMSGSYGFIYSKYTHPDSVTKFTKFRINKLTIVSAGMNYSVNDDLKLYFNFSYQRNNSNLPTGFILSVEDASTLVGVQSPSLGDYHKYQVMAGVSLDL